MFSIAFALMLANDPVAPIADGTTPPKEVTTKKVCKTIEIPTSRMPKRICETVVVKKEATPQVTPGKDARQAPQSGQ